MKMASYCFGENNSVGIGQYTQNELSVERSIFVYVAPYQLISLNLKLNGYRKEQMIVPHGTKTTKTVVKGF